MLTWEPTNAEISAEHVAGIVSFQGRFLAYASSSDSSGTPLGVSLWSTVEAGSGLTRASLYRPRPSLLVSGQRVTAYWLSGSSRRATPPVHLARLAAVLRYGPQPTARHGGSTSCRSRQSSSNRALPPDVRELMSQPGLVLVLVGRRFRSRTTDRLGSRSTAPRSTSWESILS